jgi:hypothetical protein
MGSKALEAFINSGGAKLQAAPMKRENKNIFLHFYKESPRK